MVGKCLGELRWQNNIEMNLREMDCEGRKLIELAHDGVQYGITNVKPSSPAISISYVILY